MTSKKELNQSQPPIFNIFISYSSKDKGKVAPVKGALSRIAGARIFFAEENMPPGAPIDQKIITEIKNCDLFIVFYSSNSESSVYVQQEIGAAFTNNKPIIPIIIDESKPKGMIAQINYLDFSKPEKALSDFGRLNSYISQQIGNKKRSQGLLTLAALAGLGYLLSREDNHEDED